MLSTAAVMPGPLLITLIALLTTCEAFRLGSSQRVIPLGPPVPRLVQDEVPAQTHILQELVRSKRHSASELVRSQPHLVHDMGWPEIHETSRSQRKMDAAVNTSQLNPPSAANQGQSRTRTRTRTAMDENLDVEDEMERMVHLVVPQDAEKELGGGPGAGDTSLEASGFYGTDTEDRDRGEEGGEERERRGGEDEWERGVGEERERRRGDVRGREEEEGDHDHELDVLEANHTTPDLDSLIGYSPSLHQEPEVSAPAEVHDSGLQEHRGPSVLEVGPLGRELWEAEKEEGGHSSGYGVLHSSITTTVTTPTSTSTADEDPEATVTLETDTGTDFGLLGSYTRDEIEDEETEKEEEEGETGLTNKGVFTQNPTVPEVGMAPSREPLQPSVEEEEEEEGHRISRIGPKDKGDELEEEEWRRFEETGIRPILPLTTDPSHTSWDQLEKTTPLAVSEMSLPVVCLDWSELAGRGYVVLNMTQNVNCEEFRVDQGVRLLRILERVFARRMNSPEGSWALYLSKPTHEHHQLLMNVASGQGVIETKVVLDMLGQIRKSLSKVGIQNYSAPGSCQSRPRQTRSDYGKLFVVLVIIGSVCMVIITSGFIYICWQRRLPATKTNFRAEELHFVENGCHDNPTLDVANDSQPEMQEKKPSANGLAGGGEGGGEDSKRWQVFVNQAATDDDEEEQDTHL